MRRQLPWIGIHYAIKSNPIKEILTLVRDNGLGFDCASESEIERVMNLGVKAKDIIYSNSVKNEKDIVYAMKQGV